DPERNKADPHYHTAHSRIYLYVELHGPGPHVEFYGHADGKRTGELLYCRSCTDHFEVGAREIDGTFPRFDSRKRGPSGLDCKLLTRLIEVGEAVAIQDEQSQLVDEEGLE